MQLILNIPGGYAAGNRFPKIHRYILSEFFEENRKEYYSRLRAITDDNKWNEWINYFLGAIINQAELNTQRAKL
ncbi:MAG: hypothetical protein J7K15_10135, partial [Deltaproteobacteria bacterium]|nr:hypothetical protein [Deltaproteobacteria bacterium]